MTLEVSSLPDRSYVKKQSQTDPFHSVLDDTGLSDMDNVTCEVSSSCEERLVSLISLFPETNWTVAKLQVFSIKF